MFLYLDEKKKYFHKSTKIVQNNYERQTDLARDDSALWK